VRQDIVDLGGGGLLIGKCNNSIPTMVTSVYNEYEWLPWKFSNGVPKHYWEDVNNQRKFMDWVGKQLEYKEFCDWYKITQKVRKN
jgi:hypothetical protein